MRVPHFAIRTPPIPVIVGTLETRSPNACPIVTTVRDQDPLILMKVDNFGTQEPNASPKVTTDLAFRKHDPLVNFQGKDQRESKSDNSTLRDQDTPDPCDG